MQRGAGRTKNLKGYREKLWNIHLGDWEIKFSRKI